MINYELTKQAEDNLSKTFFKYVDHVLKEWNYLLEGLKKSKKISPQRIQEIFKMEEQSNHFEAEILDDCIWTISKYQPVANHLRFVISIINSIKDLERMADYVISTAKFIYLHDTFDEEQIDLIIEGIQASITAVTEILNLLTIKKEDKINNEISIFQESTKIHSSYNVKYQNIINKLSRIAYDESTASKAADAMNNCFIILKHTERSVDHAINIIENFVYIRESNFFYDKHSKQMVNSKACEFFKKAKEQKTIAKKSIAKKNEKENK